MKTGQAWAQRKKLLAALGGKATHPPPVWLMRQAGRYLPEYRATRAKAGSFLDLCFTPQLAAEVTLQPIRRYELDAAIVFSDILVIPYALGQRVEFVEGEGPRLDRIAQPKNIDGLRRDAVSKTLQPVYETLSILRRELPQQTALIGFAGAPWTVATYMVEGGPSTDFAVAKRLAFADPLMFGRLIDVLIEATTEYLNDQITAGAEVLQLFDSWAGVLSPREFRRWVIAPTRTLVQRIKDKHPATPIIGFPRGAGMLYADYARDTGVDAVSLDTTVPMEFAMALQARLPVQGNLDPQVLTVGGKALRDESTAILEALSSGPFVFNLGHGIVPETPPEHVAELVRIVREAPR